MYDYLIDHVGHNIVITHYKEIDEVAIECEDCYEVLLTFRKDDDEDEEKAEFFDELTWKHVSELQKMLLTETEQWKIDMINEQIKIDLEDAN